MIGTATHGTSLDGLKKLVKRSPVLFALALERPAIQMLTWMNTGSPRDSRTPPIRTGALRGSGSAFVGQKIVATAPAAGGGSDEKPAKSSNAPTPLTVHWVFNTKYAAKMHEWEGSWGKFTEQAGDAGSKWMERHIRADRNAFTEFIAKEFKKGLNAMGGGI